MAYSLSSQVGLRSVFLDDLCEGRSDEGSEHNPSHVSTGCLRTISKATVEIELREKAAVFVDPRKCLSEPASCAKVSAIRNFKLINRKL
jgi:hypothetical protein